MGRAGLDLAVALTAAKLRWDRGQKPTFHSGSRRVLTHAPLEKAERGAGRSGELSGELSELRLSGGDHNPELGGVVGNSGLNSGGVIALTVLLECDKWKVTPAIVSTLVLHVKQLTGL